MAPPPLLKWLIISHRWVTHDVFEFKLQKPEGFNFKAGQYLSIVIPGAGPGGRNLRRAYSIASSPEMSEIEICVKKVTNGPGSTYLSNLKEGDAVEAQAPFGDFVLNHDLNLPCLMIGTGTGIAPLRSMVLSKEWNPKAPVSFLLGVRNEADILYPEMFEEMNSTNAFFKGNPNSKICLSRPNDSWKGFKGRVTDWIYAMDREKKWDFSKTHTYLCGSGDMLKEIKNFLMETKGIPKEQIHSEKYY